MTQATGILSNVVTAPIASQEENEERVLIMVVSLDHCIRIECLKQCLFLEE